MIKMTDSSIKEIKQVYDLMIEIIGDFPFGYSESWLVAKGKKNGEKREICGIFSFDCEEWRDFETNEISIGISISTTARINLHGETVHYPKEFELGKAALLKTLLSEGLDNLKLKYFEVEISDNGLEDDGDNGWEHWMGYDLTPIQSVFEKEKEEETRKRHELHVRIYDTVEKMPLTEKNIKKLLKFDNEISGFDRVAKISNNKIYDYGKMKNPDYIDDTIPCSMTFKEYLSHFYASSCWGIEGCGYDEKDADEISEMFDDLELDLGDKMGEISEIKTLNKKDLANKLLNEINIERMEEKGWIGPDKSLEEISGHFNDVFLETIWEDDIRPFWDAILNEAAKKYMESLPMEKKEETREEIIDKIIESCEEDTTLSAIKKLCEWLVDNSKHIRRHLLDVSAVQLYVNEKIHTIGGIYLYSEKDADDTIIDLDTWAYYEKKGEGDNFSKEELKELYEKL